MSTAIQEQKREQAVSREESLLRLIAEAYSDDPGTSDLYDEQPVSLSITLKEVRLARRLLREPQQIGGLTEEVCQLARYELDEARLLDSRITSAAEDEIVEEFAKDIQLFVGNWIVKRLAVERLET